MGKVVELNREDNQNVCRFVWARMRSKNYITNILLACIAVALEVYYSICGGSCSYLKGDLLRIPLQYIGIAYMACIVFFSILKWDRLLLVLLSAGVGIEIYLIGFQIWHNTYCPYCLAFGGIIFLLFLLNIDRNRKKLSVISMGLALILFSIFFEGSVTPSYAGEVLVPTFGEGKVKVRLYTDYFCPPCRAMEQDLEPVIIELIKNKVINITFADTPFYKSSSLYVRYFLYAIQEKKDFTHALKVRNTLIEAAKTNIEDKEKLEAFLREKGITFKPFDPKPAFDILSGYMKEDQIKATPTCVIEMDGNKNTYVGGTDIINALKGLKQEQPKKPKSGATGEKQ